MISFECLQRQLLSVLVGNPELTSSWLKDWPSILLMRNDLLRLDLYLPLESRVDDAGIPLLGPTQIPMKGIHDPTQKLDWITLFRHLEFACTPLAHFLQEFVGRDMCLEQSRVP
jgi:hypothetical protein